MLNTNILLSYKMARVSIRMYVGDVEICDEKYIFKIHNPIDHMALLLNKLQWIFIDNKNDVIHLKSNYQLIHNNLPNSNDNYIIGIQYDNKNIILHNYKQISEL